MMKKWFLLICVIASTQAFAQDGTVPEKKGGLDPSRLFFGGNFGASFGNFTFINVSPQVGYRITPSFSAGTGVNFIYQSNKINYGSYTQKSNYGYAGLNVFGRLNLFKFLLANVQPELNYAWGKISEDPGNFEVKQPGEFVPSLLLGGGVAIPTGRNGAMVAMIQYDVLQNDLSPYGKRAFVTFGFNF
ncbi:MAG: hypothetical protein EAZ17_03160 [Sphingobacteriales bacterium]|nr:MAG: hypothetical protein EAZ17_03160 [Sphingobacteriales bacterium]